MKPHNMTAEEQAAQRGAFLLDSERPGWFWEIDKETLDLGACAHCLLGQLFGHFALGCDFFDIWQQANSPYSLVVGHGFEIADNADTFAAYDALAVAWLQEIDMRRSAA